MSAAKRLTTPLKDSDLENLQVGDKVFLTGIIYTGRDAAHKRLVELLDAGKALPFDSMAPEHFGHIRGSTS